MSSSSREFLCWRTEKEGGIPRSTARRTADRPSRPERSSRNSVRQGPRTALGAGSLPDERASVIETLSIMWLRIAQSWTMSGNDELSMIMLRAPRRDSL